MKKFKKLFLSLSLVFTMAISAMGSQTLIAQAGEATTTKTYYAKGNKITELNGKYSYNGKYYPYKVVTIEPEDDDTSKLSFYDSYTTKEKNKADKAGTLNALKIVAEKGAGFAADKLEADFPIAPIALSLYDIVTSSNSAISGFSKTTQISDAKNTMQVNSSKIKRYVYIYYNKKWRGAYQTDKVTAVVTSQDAFKIKGVPYTISHTQRVTYGSLTYSLRSCCATAINNNGNYWPEETIESLKISSYSGQSCGTVKFESSQNPCALGMKCFDNAYMLYY